MKIMKRLILISSVFLLLFLNAKAQDTEIVSQLTPYRNYLQKKLEENKNIVCILTTPIKPKRLDVTFGVDSKYIRNGENTVIFTVQTLNNKLIYEEINGKLQSRMRLVIRVFSKDYKIDGVFEDEIDNNLSANLSLITTIDYQKKFKLPTGKYTVKFLLSDIPSGWYSTKKINFEIK